MMAPNESINSSVCAPSISTATLERSEDGSEPKGRPPNTLVNSQAQQEQNQMLQGVITNLISNYTSCFWPFWRQRKPDFDRFGLEHKETYEIGLDCIEIDFNKNYIGGGNQSSVFRGKWNGRYIALKKLNRASEVDIDKLVKLDHPNVIRTLGISSKEIYPCIIMEYCEQGGLFDVLRKTHVDKKRFVEWSKGIAAGMQYLHSLKIVHRDLKSPNILVDKDNQVKICDFGSLYSWDKTYMPSVVMSVCGTSQWMSPEMMKNEPCNEKVDIWSFGVVLWELLFQEVPYKNLPPMAIMFNVGSDRLKLHIPRTAPDCYKFLLKICFAKRPRNRPSFASVLNHLENIRVEIESISDDAWRMRKEAWKKELNDEADKLKLHSNNAEAEAVKVENLVTKRMHELRHAQELNQLYKMKMKRLDKLMDKLMYNLQHIQCMEMSLEERERRVAEEEARLSQLSSNASCYPVASTSTNPSAGCFGGIRGPELKSVKLQPRPSTVRTNLRSNKTYTDIYQQPGQHAILTMQVDAEDLDEPISPEGPHTSTAYPQSCYTSPSHIHCSVSANDMGRRLNETVSHSVSSLPLHTTDSTEELAKAPPRSRHSYALGAHQNSLDSPDSRFSSRVSSARSSLNMMQRQTHGSIPHLRRNGQECDCQHKIQPEFDRKSDLEQCNCSFKRNTPIRTSGASCDSGFYGTVADGSMMSINTSPGTCQCLLPCNECQSTDHQRGSYTPSDLYRNQQARWSDGLIHRRSCLPPTSLTPTRSTANMAKRSRRHTASAFARGSPARVPNVKRRNQSKPKDLKGRSTGNLALGVENLRKQTSLEEERYGNFAELHGIHMEEHGNTPKYANFVERNQVQTRKGENIADRHGNFVERHGTMEVRPSERSQSVHNTNNNRLVDEYDDGEYELDDENDDEDEDGVNGFDEEDAVMGDDEETRINANHIMKRIRRPIEEAILEMDSSMSSSTKSNKSPKKSHLRNNNVKAMEQSTSTMASSLERSLEMGAGDHDGLSDKEKQLKAVTKSYQRHRRCASNPVCIVEGPKFNRLKEVSTESDESGRC